jgi:hypothetical protein
MKEFELYETMKKYSISEVRTVLCEYIRESNSYGEFINFITTIVQNQYDDITKKMMQGKAAINFFYGNDDYADFKVTKDNWFTFARLLKFSEDESTPKMNYLYPVDMLKKINTAIDKNKAPKFDGYPIDTAGLYEFIKELNVKYKDKL